MRRSNSFWLSLERYAHQVLKRSGLVEAWLWFALGMIALSTLSSLISAKYSVASTQNIGEVIEKAVESGNYELAKKLVNQKLVSTENRVLGARSDSSSDETRLEDRVYPERAVERKITELELLLDSYPNHFEILLELSRLNSLVDEMDKASEYREKARILDPNNEMFK